MVARRAGQSLRVRIVQLQRVQREVVRLELQRSFERFRPAGERLARGVVQQVDVDRLDAGRPGRMHRLGHVPGCVPPTERRQLLRDQALGPERDPGHAGQALGDRIAPFIRSGVGLEAHLGVWDQTEPLADPIEDLGEGAGRQERGRPATEVDGLQGRPTRLRRATHHGQPEAGVEGVGAQVQFHEERRDKRSDPVGRTPGPRARHHHEVAVRADRDAERHVDVQPHRRPRNDAGHDGWLRTDAVMTGGRLVPWSPRQSADAAPTRADRGSPPASSARSGPGQHVRWP